VYEKLLGLFAHRVCTAYQHGAYGGINISSAGYIACAAQMKKQKHLCALRAKTLLLHGEKTALCLWHKDSTAGSKSQYQKPNFIRTVNPLLHF
jgi:hypothetical protein